MQASPESNFAPPRASVDAVLRFAWDAAAFVSDDAMAWTGLTRSTTIAAIDELIGIGLLHELANARAAGEYRKGRPSRRFELRADAAVVIGLDAGRSHLTATVADLRGNTLAGVTVELDASHDSPNLRRAAVVAAIDSALLAAGRSRSSVLSICVGVPAPVDSHGKSPHHRDNFWRRMNPDLRSMLGEWFPIVRIENDASLAAVAEGSAGGAVDCENYVVLLAGDRFGAGVVIDGHLLRGAHGGIGEMVAFDHVTGVETANGIGTRLTDWARTAVASGELPAGHVLTGVPIEQVTGRAVLALSASGDAWARGLVDRAGHLLSRIAAVFGSLYDPARIIISGAVAEGLEEVLAVARTHVPDELDLPAPELMLSTLGSASVATGAVAAAIEAARDNVLHLGNELPHATPAPH